MNQRGKSRKVGGENTSRRLTWAATIAATSFVGSCDFSSNGRQIISLRREHEDVITQLMALTCPPGSDPVDPVPIEKDRHGVLRVAGRQGLQQSSPCAAPDRRLTPATYFPLGHWPLYDDGSQSGPPL